jgi:hypothetical protein
MSYYCFQRNSLKLWKKLFLHLFDLALANAQSYIVRRVMRKFGSNNSVKNLQKATQWCRGRNDSGCKITPSLSDITMRREDGKGKGQQDGKESVWACTVNWKHFFFLLILTPSVTFWYNDFHTTLYFVNQKNYKETSNAGTHLNLHALLLQLKHNNFTFNSTRKDSVISPYVLLLCSLVRGRKLFFVKTW